MQRRHLLRGLALCLSGWALAPLDRALARPGSDPGRRLVVLMLRGAVDGLSVVAPYGDRDYARSRPTLALDAPGQPAGLLRLDTLFGLHPALAPLHGYWERGLLGFVHASGSPDPTRSHFDAQDYMETGTPGVKSTEDGWMNRLLGQLPDPAPQEAARAMRALSLGNTPARILAGAAPVASLGSGPRALDAKAIDQPRLQASLDRLYAQDPALAGLYRDAAQSRAEMRRSLQAADAAQAPADAASASAMAPAMGGGMRRDAVGGDPAADRGAASATGFAADAYRLGRLIHQDRRAQLAFGSVGGWDTHANQGAATGQLANRLGALAQGLDALARGLGDSLRDTAIVVMSEFGRTLRQNGTGGTDHGRANVMWLLGGPFAGGAAGGRVLGEWPGLDDAALEQGRDLRVVTDFRQVLTPILRGHLGLTDAGLAAVFPQLPARQGAPLNLLRG